ncbi:S-methyl-5-thioribose-1-phosphate isomerase [Thiohalobacter sp. IOR34]|uniref:S-methyl-5-thioribose-1-phosphate isomerase n=1 Tax=Thiohalobacter sp. IOR34 TaxID=3057176 RepID=UPI0025B2309E|nr:S-methyl-5-thioribose-1-phosphate isomerase [Thiohalobacter sp. IOR34]WJW76683.1 S-methyl-5-thioribose-1-phosphate isomerase [Thiohalobacter sp. IOR34]
MTPHQDSVSAIEWKNERLFLLDQRRLPREEVWLELRDAPAAADAIRDMVVRGAPAIGITAAYAVVLAAQRQLAASPGDWRKGMDEDLQRLAQSRPTAVNLFWALDRMRRCLAQVTDNPLGSLLDEARAIHQEDIAANRRMGELGAALLPERCGVLTHCNAGALATGGYGTALGVIRSGWTAGRIDKVFADETRPWLQGARLTAWELIHDGIPTTLLAEGAAAHLMKSGRVQWVIVGSDRIAANGDVANKIGTYSLAVNARHHGVKFMVVAPTSTIDMATPDGSGIPIENRDPNELLSFDGRPIAAAGADAWNPVFDVTPAELIDAIVTEKGVVERPTTEKLARLGVGQ